MCDERTNSKEHHQHQRQMTVHTCVKKRSKEEKTSVHPLATPSKAQQADKPETSQD